MFKYSNYSQPLNYSDRVAVSMHVSDIFSLNKQFTILVDDLTPHNNTGNNPLWCEWGPAPNSAWLIHKDKDTGEVKIVLAQTWFHIEQMDKAIEQVLSPGTTYTSTSTSTLSNDASTAYLQEPKEVAEAKAAWFREHNRGGCGPRS